MHYHFTSLESMRDAVARGDFIEHAEVGEQYLSQSHDEATGGPRSVPIDVDFPRARAGSYIIFDAFVYCVSFTSRNKLTC